MFFFQHFLQICIYKLLKAQLQSLAKVSFSFKLPLAHAGPHKHCPGALKLMELISGAVPNYISFLIGESNKQLNRGLCVYVCVCAYVCVSPLRCRLRSAHQTITATGRRTAVTTLVHSSTSAPSTSSSPTSCSTCSWVRRLSPRRIISPVVLFPACYAIREHSGLPALSKPPLWGEGTVAIIQCSQCDPMMIFSSTQEGKLRLELKCEDGPTKSTQEVIVCVFVCVGAQFVFVCRSTIHAPNNYAIPTHTESHLFMAALLL